MVEATRYPACARAHSSTYNVNIPLMFFTFSFSFIFPVSSTASGLLCHTTKSILGVSHFMYGLRGISFPILGRSVSISFRLWKYHARGRGSARRKIVNERQTQQGVRDMMDESQRSGTRRRTTSGQNDELRYWVNVVTGHERRDRAPY